MAINDDLYKNLKEKLLNDLEFQKQFLKNAGIKIQDDGTIIIGGAITIYSPTNKPPKRSTAEENNMPLPVKRATRNPATELGGSEEKKSFEALKSRIHGLGNKGLSPQVKQDMITSLRLHQKKYPEDAKEASNLIDHLRNR